jgi:hypothetical protein
LVVEAVIAAMLKVKPSTTGNVKSRAL